LVYSLPALTNLIAPFLTTLLPYRRRRVRQQARQTAADAPPNSGRQRQTSARVQTLASSTSTLRASLLVWQLGQGDSPMPFIRTNSTCSNPPTNTRSPPCCWELPDKLPTTPPHLRTAGSGACSNNWRGGHCCSVRLLRPTPCTLPACGRTHCSNLQSTMQHSPCYGTVGILSVHARHSAACNTFRADWTTFMFAVGVLPFLQREPHFRQATSHVTLVPVRSGPIRCWRDIERHCGCIRWRTFADNGRGLHTRFSPIAGAYAHRG